ncbi:amino acid ABC transporter permease [Vandammella animalimorsus]|uniref:Amino acid ABC transporter permease n=1 Tax=Vandammella animalimorsus TaxID=2029117 RepID=A0A2A2A8A0_9BURK|nr:ABC transporter permease subunit [Vandammella animalimorsus]RRD67329.1 ABC transporter permease subunit [Comamonadaceae bacterium OH2310_COT-174]PAT31194.1 amino acid ABC transporter permease [Vandammella animalimorsus]PAT33968.1 amino acid ABC transporter permease [Vandammella animalimorsus]PAT41837.1 amino acid ABC transporter permease [Vandammella animalimorsus]PAX16157.1 amino acid ABC transporter permease [Vandammella animalimorsus]
MQWAVIFEPATLQLYFKGLWSTFAMLAGLLLAGGIAGVVFALMLVSRSWILQRIASTFTYFVRGTPLLIQIYLIYFGIAQLQWVQALWDTVWPLTHFKNPLFCAMLAFSINHAGYLAEILAGAIRDTSRGEVEAAYAMGMGRWQVMRRIVLPSAMRRALPPYSNEVMQMMHGTSLASSVPGLFELTSAASKVNRDYYLTFEAYLFAAALYLVVTFTMMGLFRLAEKRYTAYLQPHSH